MPTVSGEGASVPRLTDRYRQSKRDEIADAVLRCMASIGYTRLSMPDIFAESGLSAGSVYSHFQSKAELGVYVAHRAHRVFVDAIEDFEESNAFITPPDLCRWLLHRLSRQHLNFPALLQFWAESTTESPIRAALTQDMTHAVEKLADTLMPWAIEDTTSDEDASRSARRAVEGILVLANGFVSRSALYGEIDVESFLGVIETVLPGAQRAAHGDR
jgi:AcrR family transcriptional regulator